MMIHPLRPEEVSFHIESHVPPEVIEVFNDLLVKHYNGEYAIINQSEVLEALSEKMGIYNQSLLDEKWLLDVQRLYHRFGWNVIYSRPEYFERQLDPVFTFRPHVMFRRHK